MSQYDPGVAQILNAKHRRSQILNNKSTETNA